MNAFVIFLIVLGAIVFAASVCIALAACFVSDEIAEQDETTKLWKQEGR